MIKNVQRGWDRVLKRFSLFYFSENLLKFDQIIFYKVFNVFRDMVLNVFFLVFNVFRDLPEI